MKWWPSRELIDTLKDEITILRALHGKQQERIDRLTEALARKANVDLIMPLPDITPEPPKYVPNPWKDPSPISVNFGIEEKK